MSADEFNVTVRRVAPGDAGLPDALSGIVLQASARSRARTPAGWGGGDLAPFGVVPGSFTPGTPTTIPTTLTPTGGPLELHRGDPCVESSWSEDLASILDGTTTACPVTVGINEVAFYDARETLPADAQAALETRTGGIWEPASAVGIAGDGTVVEMPWGHPQLLIVPIITSYGEPVFPVDLAHPVVRVVGVAPFFATGVSDDGGRIDGVFLTAELDAATDGSQADDGYSLLRSFSVTALDARTTAPIAAS